MVRTNAPDYTVKRSNRKTLSIYIERDGRVSVLAPKELDEQRIDELVQSKSYQIYKFLAQQEELNRPQRMREVVNGESFLYLGRSYQLKIVKDLDLPLQLKQGYFMLRAGEKNRAEEHFKAFYKEKGASRIQNRVEYFSSRMRLKTGIVKVMELQNRWASCTKKGDLNFHWKCMMAPLTVLDYIIVHELAHLRHDNHSQAFWNEVDKVLPNYQEQKAWLKMNGAGLTI